MVKRILRHTLLGITYLQFHAITHGNIHYGNLLFVAPKLYIANTNDNLQSTRLRGISHLKGWMEGLTSRLRDTYPPPFPLFRDANRGFDFVNISDLGLGKPPKDSQCC